MSFLLSYAFCYKNSVHSVLSFQSRQRSKNIPAGITLFSSFRTRILLQRYKIIVLFSIGSVFPVFPFCSYSHSSLCWNDSGLTAVSVVSVTESSLNYSIIPSHYKFSYLTSSSIKFLAKPYIYNPTYFNRLLDNPQGHKHTCFWWLLYYHKINYATQCTILKILD
jgi:hypothetical protein